MAHGPRNWLQCGTTWQLRLTQRSATLDLRDVTYVDVSGMQVLRQICREKHPAILTGSPLTESFAEQAQRNTTNDHQEND